MTARRTWQTYVRAFIGALRMTLRGEKIAPQPARYPALMRWLAEGSHLINAAYLVAKAAGLDETARKAHTFALEGRTTSMELILSAARFNLLTEYPLLIETQVDHHLTALYASNMNDQFRMARLATTLDAQPALQAAVQALADHLSQIPSKQALEKDE